MTVSEGSRNLKDGGQERSKVQINGLNPRDAKLKNVKVSDGFKD